MYSELSIAALISRIGFEKPMDTAFAITIDEEVLLADSGRKVNSFHQLATVENLYAAVQIIDMEAVEFNGFLSSLREQSVKEIMTAILDQNVLYDELVDYSSIIISRPTLFDDAIGYCIAIKALELFISSSRSNLLERNTKLSFQSLKIELEGVRNDGGFFVAKGINYKMERAIQKAQKILFANPIIIDGTSQW